MEKNEKDLLKAFENGEFKTIKDFDKEKKHYSLYARESLKKNKRLNIRISAQDLEGVQRIALKEGIPYQTLVSSIIHKFVLRDR